ncbi:GDSL-type esterase/lipase family protein [Aquimarina sp. RZ0]|uniref:SGNH/GDSL hydrolase family protein n=1 Tax=Aquimarina sp. RZ0 TaxID=2607730 RepID=UPI0011F1C9BC|nr:GDSL-type esterase/lipase family protein [Aquimarina sp. RZ0]KAA1243504.1 hypothetical protein F0000_20685 [Aquimarina sp. RZ0]
MLRSVFIKNSLLGISSVFFGDLIVQSCSTEKFPFKKNQRIGCIGDSVTYSGGNGYVELLQQSMDETSPEYNLKCINLGLNSETITGLTEGDHLGARPYLFDRLETVLDANDLDVLFFCYGINCGIYNPPSVDIFDKYKKGVIRYLEIIKSRNIRTILLTPPPLLLVQKDNQKDKTTQNTQYSWKNPYPRYDQEVIQQFRDIILQIHHPSVIAKIDIHTPLTQEADQSYSTDPIHPNNHGNQLIVDTIVKSLL